jgi:hypothetical protein
MTSDILLGCWTTWARSESAIWPPFQSPASFRSHRPTRIRRLIELSSNQRLSESRPAGESEESMNVNARASAGGGVGRLAAGCRGGGPPVHLTPTVSAAHSSVRLIGGRERPSVYEAGLSKTALTCSAAAYSGSIPRGPYDMPLLRHVWQCQVRMALVNVRHLRSDSWQPRAGGAPGSSALGQRGRWGGDPDRLPSHFKSGSPASRCSRVPTAVDLSAVLTRSSYESHRH